MTWAEAGDMSMAEVDVLFSQYRKNNGLETTGSNASPAASVPKELMSKGVTATPI